MYIIIKERGEEATNYEIPDEKEESSRVSYLLDLNFVDSLSVSTHFL